MFAKLTCLDACFNSLDRTNKSLQQLDTLHLSGAGTTTNSIKCGQLFSGLEYSSGDQHNHAGQCSADRGLGEHNQYGNTNTIHRCERLYIPNDGHFHHASSFFPAIPIVSGTTIGYRDQPAVHTTTSIVHRPQKLSAYIAETSGKNENNINRAFQGSERARNQASSVSLPPFSRSLGFGGRDSLLRQEHKRNLPRSVGCCEKHDPTAKGDATARRGVAQNFHGPDGCATRSDQRCSSIPSHDWNQHPAVAVVSQVDRCRTTPTTRAIPDNMHCTGGGSSGGGGGTSNEFYIEINLR